MRLAIISDIHGNLEALQQVLEDIRVCGAEAIISLGDNVGYGADSEAVVNILAQRQIPSVIGNHELALSDPATLAWFNPQAREVVLKVSQQLSPRSLEWIQRLPEYLVSQGCRFVHGFIPDSVSKYLFERSENEIRRAMSELGQPLSFCGHTHMLEMYYLHEGDLKHTEMKPGRINLDPQTRYLVNAGSVGQPPGRRPPRQVPDIGQRRPNPGNPLCAL